MRGLPEHIDVVVRQARWRCEAGRSVGASDSFVLNGACNGWLVLTGAVDLFIASVDDGVAAARRQVMRVSAGGVLFGLGDADSTVRWFAVPLGDTTLAAFDLQVAAEVSDFSGAFESWATEIVSGLAGPAPSSEAIRLPSGAHFVSSAISFTGETQAHWCIFQHGSAHIVGLESVVAQADATPWPLGRWLQFTTTTEAEVKIIERAGCFRPEDIGAAIANMARLGEACHILLLEREAQGQAQRLKHRLALDAKLMASADAVLVNLLVPSAFDSAIANIDDPVVKAVTYLAAREHIDFHCPKELPARTLATEARLVRLLASARLMWRRARIDDDWQEGEAGAFLAIDRRSDTPLVVFPNWRSRYVMYDPQTGEHQPLDAECLEHFAEWVIVVGRPLPTRPLANVPLMRFGLAGQRREMLSMLSMGFLIGLLGLLTPLISSTIFGDVIPDAETDELLQYGGLLIAMTVAIGLFSYAQVILTTRMSGRLDNSLQAGVWDRILRLPVSFFRDYTAGDLANRALGINTINSTLTTVTLTSILTGLFASLNLILMLWYAWQLAIIGLALAIVTLLATLGFTIRQLVWQRRATDVQGRQTGLALQLINGIHKLRVANAEDRAYAIWAMGFAEQNNLALRAQRLASMLAVFNSIMPTLGATLIFVAIAWLIGKIGIADFVAFNAAFGQFFSGTVGLSAAISSVVSVWPLYRRVKPILAAMPEVDEFKADPGELQGRIAVEHLSFAFEGGDVPILDDISLTAEPGEFVAVVGSSGSGKTTLIRLLIGFERPSRGTVFLDGKDLAGLDLHAVRRQLGVVVQNSHVMPGNIFQNIVGNNADLTVEDAWHAEELVGLADDIRAMPMGLETFISESGGNFSTGQRQRLMLARAVAMRPRILILDEATSALDNATQAVVTQNLARLDATRIVIAQRLSTIIGADRIYVLANGRIHQHGSYEQLMHEPGLFRDFMARQIQ